MVNSIWGNGPNQVFVGLSLGVTALIAILYFDDKNIFQRFLGNLNPLVVVFAIVLLGFVLMSFLRANDWFAVYNSDLQGLVLTCGLGLLLALIMVAFDSRVVLPEDINILFPQSLLFYPAIGYVAEIIFHLLPLSLLLALLTAIFPQANLNQIIWLSILIVSLVEAVYQGQDLANEYPLWVVTYVGLHLFVFNLIQLSLFKRYGFVPMYVCRLAYYLVWHIVWGYIRLRLLF